MWFHTHLPCLPDAIVRFAALPFLAAALFACDGKVTKQEQPAEAGTGGVYLVDDFPGRDDREKINNALAAMENIEGEKTLRFADREYLVRPASKDSFDPVLGGTNLRNLTIDGSGAVLVALDSLDCRKGYFFRVGKFNDLSVKNLTLTYRPAPFVQGRIVSVDQANNRTAIALDPLFGDVEALVQTPMSKLWCRVGQSENALWPKQGSPSWMDVGVDDSGRLIAEPAGPGRVTVRAGFFDLALTLNGEYNWQPGDPLVIWKRGAQDGFYFEEGSGLSLDNIRVEAALHYAIKLRGVIGATVADCHVSPAPGAMISGSADGIDVQQSRDIVIEKCVLVATGDDAISFLNHGHGDNGLLFETRFGSPYPETNEDVVIRDNLIEGGNRNAILLLSSRAEISGNTLRHTRQYGIKFTGDDTRISNNRLTELGSFAAYRHITDELDTGVICSDEWNQRGASIRDNVIEDWHHMPAILLKSLTNARVTGNTFLMQNPGRLGETPFNPYLKTIPAVCVTHGHFNGATTRSSEIAIDDNVIQSRGGWRDAADAIVINGSHDRVEAKNNEIKTLSAAIDASPRLLPAGLSSPTDVLEIPPKSNLLETPQNKILSSDE